MTFLREVWPDKILTADWATPKCRASAFVIAALANPLTGGSFTQISKLVSLSFLIDSILLFGFALTKIFITKFIPLSFRQILDCRLRPPLWLRGQCRLYGAPVNKSYRASILQWQKY